MFVRISGKDRGEESAMVFPPSSDMKSWTSLRRSNGYAMFQMVKF